MNLGGQEPRWAGPPAAHRSALFILSCHLAQPLKVPFHSLVLGLAFVDGPRADTGSGWSMAFPTSLLFRVPSPTRGTRVGGRLGTGRQVQMP